jgi:hypothetical protein
VMLGVDLIIAETPAPVVVHAMKARDKFLR